MIKLITEFPVECKICGHECKRTEGLTKHLKSKHNTNQINYTIDYLMNGDVPKCKCGCDKEVNVYEYRYNEYVKGHTGGGWWQLKYDKDSEEYLSIVEKISDTVSKHHKEFPVIISEEQKKKQSGYMKNLYKNNPNEFKRRIEKMTQTKRRQSKEGILSEKHWMKKLTEEELDVKLQEIGRIISNSKRRNFNLGKTIQWNKGLTSITDPRILNYSGTNSYRYNPNKSQKYTRKFKNKKYRQELLEDQKRICFECKKDDGRQLCLHHIDENKQNDSYENLIFLCRSCHIRVHNSKIYADLFLTRVMKFKQNLNKGEN